MRVNHSLNHGAHKLVERRPSMLDQLGLNHPVDLIDVPLMQSHKDRLLVRKVLVNRPNAYPCHFRYAIRRDRTKSFTLEHPYNRIEYCIDSLMRTALFGPASLVLCRHFTL